MKPVRTAAWKLWLQSWRWRTRLWLGRNESALQALDAWLATAQLAQTVPPPVVHAMATRAHVLASVGQWAVAEQQLQTVLLHQPQRAAHWFNLGFVRAKMGCHAAAQTAFEHALALQPTLDAAWFGLGQALFDQGCWAQAEQAWARQVTLQPWCPDGLEQLVRLHQRCGEHDRAAQRLAELRRFDPCRAMALEPLLTTATAA